MYMPISQRERLADLLEMLVKKENGDPRVMAEEQRRMDEMGYDMTLLRRDSQENLDIQTLHGMGLIRSSRIHDPSSHFSQSGIFAYTITGDGREFLAEQRGTSQERQTANADQFQDAKKHPTAFISYSWDGESHKRWVKELATRLRQDGVDVKLDVWEVAFGDSTTKFMETAIRESDFVVIICTPRYKYRSDGRIGGVGYEESVITAEVFTGQSNRNKFIPVLRSGEWTDAAPSWIMDSAYADLSGSSGSERIYALLRDTLLGQTESAPPIGGL